jgi:alcohol dehydrogenase (cytochrome c)
MAFTSEEICANRDSSKPMIGGVIATGGDLVFTGELNGDFQTFNAKTGGVVYTHNVGGPIGGGLISYVAGGKQHVAVVSGFVGIYNTMAPELGGSNPTVAVFGLSSRVSSGLLKDETPLEASK